MRKWTYRKGLHEIGNGAWAWLLPDGSWGWSNAGLIVDGEESLLVDTLFDLALTREMLGAMRDAAPKAAASIGTLVNTHANGDHCHGNQLVTGAEIITSASTAVEMAELPPAALAAMKKSMADDDSRLARFFRHCFGPFEFEGIDHVEPTRTFEGEISVKVGDKDVHLIEVGPAHTRGDVIVHVPGDRTVFTGDILFQEGTPIIWAGPVQNWIDACLRIESMDVETVVPGHGPITDKTGVAAMRGYLEYIREEARKRFDSGLDAQAAARDIPLGPYAKWSDQERIAVNVDRLYGEFSADHELADTFTLFSRMAELADID